MCSKCGKLGKLGNSDLCQSCIETTCPYCQGEKSFSSQLCKLCYKSGAWDREIQHVAMPAKSDTPFQVEALIRKMFSQIHVKPHYIDLLLNHKAEFERVFTSAKFDPTNNYEIFELVGDGVANSFLSMYFLNKFPQVQCSDGVKVLARLKINYASKRSFANIALGLGFWPYIRATEEERATERESLLEDVFEAFIGATAKLLDEEFTVGVGYGIAYQLLKSIFDKMTFSLEYEDLYDAKSRLKELFDSMPALGQIKYVHNDTANPKKVEVFIVSGGKQVKYGEGEGRTKSDREQMASQQALDKLKQEGIERKRTFALLCE